MKGDEIDYLRITVLNFDESAPGAAEINISLSFIGDRSHSEFPREKDLCRYSCKFICMEIEFGIFTRWKFMENIN